MDRAVHRRGPQRDPDGRADHGDRALWQVRYTSSAGQSRCDDAGSWEILTPQFFAWLPTDPQQLYQAIGAETVTAMEKEAAVTQGERAPFNDMSDENIAAGTVSEMIWLGENSGGLSQPFSQALEQAVALVPGVVRGQEKILAGEGATSYHLVGADGEKRGFAPVFDADGNYVGTTKGAVVVGAADQAGVAP